MKKILFAVLAIGLSANASAQLAGTNRSTDNLWMSGDRKISFGPNANASIQYVSGNLVIDVTSGGGKVKFPDGIDTGTGSGSFGSSVIFEGATADAFETTISVVDPTADQTWSVPNFAVNAAFLGSSLTTNSIDAANSVWGISNSLIFEGATADAFETTLTVADPTGDSTATIPNQTGTIILSTAAQGAANSVKGVNNGFEFEGATADGNELTLVVADAGTDGTVTIPAVTGNVAVGGQPTVTTGANVACNTTCGAGKCLGGQDTGDANKLIVACSDATADRCFCLP